MKKVLITGAGAPGGPGIIKALINEYEVYGADADPKATGKSLCHHFHSIPKASDPNFIEALLALVHQNKIDVLIPLVTRELGLFAENIAKFTNLGCNVVVCNEQNLKICNNKNELLKRLREENLDVPKYKAVNTRDELIKAAKELNYPEIPVCIKPSESNGMRGFRILDENIDKEHLFWTEKPNNTYSTLDEIVRLLKPTFKQLLVMEYLSGKEYTIDCIADRGKTLLVLPRERLKMNNGISTRGKFVNHTEIIRYCNEVIKILDLHGPIGIQLREDKNGIPKMLEINPRLQGSTVAAEGMGLNIPKLIVKQALGEKLRIDLSVLPWGTEFGRYYTETFWSS